MYWIIKISKKPDMSPFRDVTLLFRPCYSSYFAANCPQLSQASVRWPCELMICGLAVLRSKKTSP
jgi:hypothetical protein